MFSFKRSNDSLRNVTISITNKVLFSASSNRLIICKAHNGISHRLLSNKEVEMLKEDGRVKEHFLSWRVTRRPLLPGHVLFLRP